jgi:hypothetical protein
LTTNQNGSIFIRQFSRIEEAKHMGAPEQSPGTGTAPVICLPDERRCEHRYHCCVKILYGDPAHDACLPEETWNVAQIVDISTRGVALALQRQFIPGSVLMFIPLIANWHHKWELTVLVRNVRTRTEGGYRVGCQFKKSLTAGQLTVLLQNSK